MLAIADPHRATRGAATRQFVWKADFEHHGANAASMNLGYIWMDRHLGSAWVWGDNQLFGNAGTRDEQRGYYSIGGRCAF